MSGGRFSKLRQLGGGASLFPLGVLVAIQLLDQATQSAFNVLTPNVRDAFHLTNAGILLIVALAGAAGLAATLPVKTVQTVMREPIAGATSRRTGQWVTVPIRKILTVMRRRF